MSIDYKLLGKRIKNARLATKKTQEQSAEYLDVSVSYVSQLERGVTKISLETLAQYAAFIEADIAELITGAAVTDKFDTLDEINLNIIKLSPKERQMLNDFISLLIKNREK